MGIIVTCLSLYAFNSYKIAYNNEASNKVCNTDDDLDSGWMYYTKCKLYYKKNGEWLYYGTYPVYFNSYDTEDGCNQWVRFSKTRLSPAEYHGNKKIKWSRRVQWKGVYYYF